MQTVEVKDLLEGDEIIISAHSDLKYLKVLKVPCVRKDGSTVWYTGAPRYKSVKCSMREDNFTNPKGYEYKIIMCTPEGHNKIIYQDLNGRTIWLVKRENNVI